MGTPLDIAPTGPRELVLARLLDASPAQLWRGWTEPELMKRWFTPPPWETIHVEQDLRPGGVSLVVMRGPDGSEVSNPGVFLEVEPQRRLTFTDAFTRAWEPSAKAFMVGTVTFEDAGDGRTRYTARARHWTDEDKAAHEAMGFHVGWGIACDQLEALAKTL